MKDFIHAVLIAIVLVCRGSFLSCDAAEQDKPRAERPQEPKRPFPYDEEEVQFDNPRAKVTLAGTFTHPKGAGLFPAVLLVAGSGPIERDEFVARHRIFLLLSDYLTRRGLAVLRYDKRGVAKSTGDYKQATTLDFADDALAGMDFLKSRKEVDPMHIGAIGHSEGGAIMPTLAVNWPDTAFVVMLAGPAAAGEEIILRQSYLGSKVEGAAKEELAMQDEILKRYIDLSKRGTDGAELERQLRALIEAANRKIGKTDNKLVDATPADFRSTWKRFFLTYTCVPVLEKVRCPLLAVNGGKDLQVTPK